MQVSTKLFNEQAIAQFNKQSAEIQDIQSKIATGKNILNASDDPTAAANLSFAKEQMSAIEKYKSNIQHANTRMTMAENALDDVTTVLTRIYELAIQGRNDSYTVQDRVSIAVEIAQLKETLVGLSNAKDHKNDFLFSGFKVTTAPFEKQFDGGVTYKGDRGVHSVQISETMKMNTSMDGGSVFLRVKTEAGRQSVFDIVSKIETDLKAGFVDKASIGEMNAAVDHIAVQRSMAGAQINKGEIQLSAIERRIVLMKEKVSGMEDADLSKLVTDLQSKMTSRDAAQQSFVKIGQQSLFDFIR